MPPLKDPREESFVQLYCAGDPAYVAFKKAQPTYKPTANMPATSLYSLASRFSKLDHIQERIQEVSTEVAASASATREFLIAKCLEIANDAHRDKKYAQAVGALKEVGILSGVRVERQVDTSNDNVSVNLIRFTGEGASQAPQAGATQAQQIEDKTEHDERIEYGAGEAEIYDDPGSAADGD